MDRLNRLASDFATWEELNEYVGMKRSEPFADYYKPMQISEEQKKQRGIFAEKLEEDIAYLLSFLFYLNRTSMLEPSALGNREIRIFTDNLQGTYISAYASADSYIQRRAQRFSQELLDVTRRHKDNPYYYSKDRARFVAEDESNTANNYKDHIIALAKFSRKQWKTILDGRERVPCRSSWSHCSD